jgi:hypothetical protein
LLMVRAAVELTSSSNLLISSSHFLKLSLHHRAQFITHTNSHQISTELAMNWSKLDTRHFLSVSCLADLV